MTQDLRPGRAAEAGTRPAATEGGDVRRGTHGSDAGVLGEAITRRLFSAGMDLHFALMVTGDGTAAPRLRHAVGELDEAIKELWYLMLAIPE